jgi:hypothetical protein
VPADGREARVEIGGDRTRPEHRDVGGKIRIDATHPRVVRALGLDIEVDDLHRCVHARIGAARGDRADRRIRDRPERALEASCTARPSGCDCQPVN